MKARLAMILSATGVLAAGTAAALVNTEVLRDDDGAPVTAPAVPTSAAPTTPPATEPSPSLAPDTTTSPTTIGSTVVQPSTPTSPVTTTPPIVASAPPATSGTGVPAPGSSTQQQFQLGDAATAILDTANGQLTIVTVAPHPGWEVDRAEQDDPTTVEIRLRSANGEVRFEASLVRGVVVVSLRNDGDEVEGGNDGDNSGSGSDSSGSGSSGSGSDDD